MSKKITLEEFKKRLKERFPEENFSVIEFGGMGKPLKIHCLNCEQIIEVNKATNFFAKNKVYGCVKCHGLWRQREIRLNEIKKLYDIIAIKVKLDTHTYYTIKCKKCGHLRCSTLPNLHKHLQCGCETGVYRGRTEEEFLKEVNKNSLEGTYQLLSPYKNQTEKVLLKHSCGFIWKVRPQDVIHGRCFCPKCGAYESKGVRFIANLLKDNDIDFQREVRLNDSLQRFDFFLTINGIEKAIEYNGKQHYKEVPYFYSTLDMQKERDERKRQYCRDNNIELLEIPYTDSNEIITHKVLDFISSTTSSNERTL